MRRLTIFTLLFLVALAVPLGYLVVRTYAGLEREEMAQLGYFAEELFDGMEEELARLVAREEQRPVDQYRPLAADGTPSPLAGPPAESYIVGYFQNNPDGGFQTPIAAQPELAARVARLRKANRAFNDLRARPPEPEPEPATPVVQKKQPANIADRYLDTSRLRKSKDRLGQQERRVEQIPVSQALNLAPPAAPSKALPAPALEESKEDASSAGPFMASVPSDEAAIPEGGAYTAAPEPAAAFEVELDPMQSVVIDERQVFVFRRIMVENRVYRQGFLVDIRALFDHLIAAHFSGQPMARFTGLTLQNASGAPILEAGPRAVSPRFTSGRVFPRPFSFARAMIASNDPPPSPGRGTLGFMVVGVTAVLLVGLTAIYFSTRAALDISQRRSRFVSTVTHELKTPLTNIRMYIEMLEQGIAGTPEREEEYFRILTAESARLSRLINNVLEFSKLEQKQRRFAMKPGLFDDVLEEARGVMGEKLRLEGFLLDVERDVPRPFPYDREAMVQILVNLMENSVKFGRFSPEKQITVRVRPEGRRMLVAVSDTGPGISRKSLTRIFDDFYREDTEITRRTKGTGLGLALVRKLARAMGGDVRARNNDGPGCTIEITLPMEDNTHQTGKAAADRPPGGKP